MHVVRTNNSCRFASAQRRGRGSQGPQPGQFNKRLHADKSAAHQRARQPGNADSSYNLLLGASPLGPMDREPDSIPREILETISRGNVASVPNHWPPSTANATPVM